MKLENEKIPKEAVFDFYIHLKMARKILTSINNRYPHFALDKHWDAFYELFELSKTLAFEQGEITGIELRALDEQINKRGLVGDDEC